MSAQRKDRAMGTGMDLAEAAGTPDFYAVGRLRARVAELEVEVNLLHRQRHAAQEDAANARLLAEVRQLSQGEIDRLRARVAEMEKQPRANELCALRNLFAAAGRTIHTASAGGRATLEEINDAWADVCAANVANRDLPAPDVVPVPMEELAVLRDGFGLLRTAWNLSLCGERIGAQAGALIERYDAIRAGEAGKGGTT